VKGRLPRAAPTSGVGDGLQLHRSAAQQCKPSLPLLFFFTNSGAAAPARHPPSGGLACRPGGDQLVQRRDGVGLPPVRLPGSPLLRLLLLPLLFSFLQWTGRNPPRGRRRILGVAGWGGRLYRATPRVSRHGSGRLGCGTGARGGHPRLPALQGGRRPWGRRGCASPPLPPQCRHGEDDREKGR
jgi:hypothetical protein